MSLFRCPGCKLDTSDSLAHCPNCGAVLHGSGPRLFDHQPAPAPDPHRQAPPAFEAAEPTPSAQATGFSTRAKVIALAVVIVMVAYKPFALPFVVMAIVFWLLAKSKKSGGQSPQMEALKILVSEVKRARDQGSQASQGSQVAQVAKERPLEML